MYVQLKIHEYSEYGNFVNGKNVYKSLCRVKKSIVKGILKKICLISIANKDSNSKRYSGCAFKG